MIRNKRVLSPAGVRRIVQAVLTRLIKGFVWLYQAVISPFSPPACRYSPTCSGYMIEAINLHGSFKGVWLGVRRISRCHPWSRCDHYDPVPSQKTPIDRDAD